MHWQRAALVLATFGLLSCSESPTTPNSELATGGGTTTEFDRLAEQFLGNSLAKEFSTRELSSELARQHPLPGHYPLELGNRWTYRRIFAVETTLTGEEPTREVLRSQLKNEIIGTEQLFGRSYTVEEQVYDEGELGIYPQWIRYRQDRSGLYEADVSVTEPPILDGETTLPPVRLSARGNQLAAVRRFEPQPGTAHAREISAARAELQRKLDLVHGVRDGLAASAPGLKEALDNELTRLSYPIVPGKTWAIREAPFVSFTVEGMQLLWLPSGPTPAWRLRLNAEYFGPNDRAVFWLGRVGFVGHVFHFETAVVDISGNEVGTMRGFERELLRSFQRAARH